MSIKRGTYIVINVKGFTALDLSNDDQTTVHGYPLHGQPNQRWLIEPTAGGFTIKNVGHGKFLSIPTGQVHDGSQVVATASPFTWVILQNICDGDAVRIQIPRTNFDVTLSNNGDPDPGTPVQIWGRNDNQTDQSWYLVRLCP